MFNKRSKFSYQVTSGLTIRGGRKAALGGFSSYLQENEKDLLQI